MWTDDSEEFCQQLLEAQFGPLPGNAEQLQDLLESGMVPVTQVGSCLDFVMVQNLLNVLLLQPGCLGRHLLLRALHYIITYLHFRPPFSASDRRTHAISRLEWGCWHNSLA